MKKYSLLFVLMLIISSSFAFAQEQEQCLQPIDAMLVIDRSGSMAGTKLTDAKSAASTFVGAVDFSQDQVGLASFNGAATLDQILTNIGADVINAINALVADGQTNIGDGLEVGRGELVANGGPTKALILLSDGAPNVDGAGIICFGAFDIGNACALHALSEAQLTKDAGIEIFVIGLGVDAATENFLKQIATSDSHYFPAASSDQLNEIYLQIAEDLCPSCGDGILNPGEECDDGPQGSDTCTPDCTLIEPGCIGECPNDIPEFTTIGAALVLAGAGAYMYRRRSRK